MKLICSLLTLRLPLDEQKGQSWINSNLVPLPSLRVEICCVIISDRHYLAAESF